MRDRATARQIEAIAQAQVHEDQCNCNGYDAVQMSGCVFGFTANAYIDVETYLDIIAEMIDRHHIDDELAHEGYGGDGQMVWNGDEGQMQDTIPVWLRS